MPELPEVETIARSLDAAGGIVAKTIRGAEVHWHKSLAFPGVEDFKKQIIGQQIVSVGRRGKFLQIFLPMQTLFIHLRMSGDVFVETDPTERDSRHDRLILVFDDGSRMVFNDTRKFGRVWLVKDPLRVTGGLGPEPLDERLDAVEFHKMLQRVNRQIKPLLMDQKFLAGLGNIYTDEALFKAGIHPLTTSRSIEPLQAEKLLNAIRAVLTEGIARNGSSIDWVYRGGDFQNHFKVYQRTGQPCACCGTLITRMIVGQRGTHFCPICQPLSS